MCFLDSIVSKNHQDTVNLADLQLVNIHTPLVVCIWGSRFWFGTHHQPEAQWILKMSWMDVMDPMLGHQGPPGGKKPKVGWLPGRLWHIWGNLRVGFCQAKGERLEQCGGLCTILIHKQMTSCCTTLYIIYRSSTAISSFPSPVACSNRAPVWLFGPKKQRIQEATRCEAETVAGQVWLKKCKKNNQEVLDRSIGANVLFCYLLYMIQKTWCINRIIQMLYSFAWQVKAQPRRPPSSTEGSCWVP